MYAIEVLHKFNIQVLDEETISERYERFVEAINVRAVGFMMQVPKLKMKLNQDPRIINAREAITSAHKEFVKKKCQSNRTLYKQKKI